MFERIKEVRDEYWVGGKGTSNYGFPSWAWTKGRDRMGESFPSYQTILRHTGYSDWYTFLEKKFRWEKPSTQEVACQKHVRKQNESVMVKRCRHADYDSSLVLSDRQVKEVWEKNGERVARVEYTYQVGPFGQGGR